MELREHTIPGLLAMRCAEQRDNVAYFFDGQGYTWHDVDRVSDRAALLLMEMGVSRGDHVGLWGVNTYGWLICYFAVRKLGAVAVLLNASCKQEEARELLDYADVAFLAVGEEKPRDELSYRAMLPELKSSLKQLKNTFFMEELLDEASVGKLSQTEQAQKLEEIKAASMSRETACIAFTSGTTHRPKGVMLTDYSMLNNAAAICERMRWTRKDRMLLAAPFYHCSGTTAGFLLGLTAGFSSVILRYYDSLKIFQSIEGFHCTAFNVVPSMPLMLMQKKEFGWYDISSYTSGTIAGSSLTPEQYEQICGAFQLRHLQPAYGQTETSPLVTLADYDDSMEKKATTVGKPLPHIELRIWETCQGKEAALGQPGEIQVRGYCVMQGYYKLPEKNAEKFTSDGWLRTGDIGYMDEDGYCHFCGRSSEMIIRGGENISPSEIEEYIERFPGVTAAKVVGVPADIVQERVVALITTKIPGFNCKELREYLQKQIARYKVPEEIFVIKQFPMTGSGKIDQKATKQLAQKLCRGISED